MTLALALLAMTIVMVFSATVFGAMRGAIHERASELDRPHAPSRF
ncbi:MAG: hypothetical protein RID59_04565 [Hoeflea sp.]